MDKLDVRVEASAPGRGEYEQRWWLPDFFAMTVVGGVKMCILAERCEEAVPRTSLEVFQKPHHRCGSTRLGESVI